MRDPVSPILRVELRDDLDAPVAGADVRITIEGERPIVARTDDRGTAAIPLEEAWRGRRARAEFDGDAYLDGSTIEIAAGDARARVELVPTLERPGALPLDEGAQVIRVHARSKAGARDVAVRVKDERGRVLADARTDSLGRAHLAIAPHDLGAPGPGRLIFESDATDALRAGSAVLPVVRTLASSIDLDEVPRTIRPGRALVVRGSLTTARGPLPGERVRLIVDGAPAAEDVTDAEGRFRLELEPGDDLAPTLEAVVRFAGSDRGADPSEVGPFVLVRRAPSPTWPFVALPLAFIALLTLARRRRLQASAESGPARRPLRALFERPSRDLRVRVVASRERGPVEGARLLLDGVPVASSDARGEIVAPDLPTGSHVVEIEAEGFLRHAFELVVPTRGSSSRDVTLIETREAATLALSEVAARRGAPRHRIETSTHREIGRRVERTHGELDELVREVDEAYYGPETPSEAKVREIEERARDHRD